MKNFILLMGFFAIFINSGCSGTDGFFSPSEDEEKEDDWQFEPYQEESKGFLGAAAPRMAMMASKSVSDSIGLSAGGAKDINNFRENVKNDFLPLPSDVTYEGLFYDYFFDTGLEQPCDKLFCPSYTSAISKDPFSEEEEYFLSVGLNSGIQQEDFKRKKLNLVIVLDISGSMSSPFDRYYYDQFRANAERKPKDETEWKKTKMQVATESVVALLDHLNPEDSLGVVLFDDQSYLAKPLRRVGSTDMEAIKGHILELQPQGGTNMSAGMKLGGELLKEYADSNSEEVENRIIFLTDAQPNLGLGEEGIAGIAKNHVSKKIHTTFIGIGVDFNTELVEKILKIRGANYYAVHSPTEFKKQMDKNFDYMVTPLVFNLELTIEAPGFEIQKVYGSPEANEATNEIMKVSTLFPSEKEEETRGGLILLHMKKISGSDNHSMKLSVSYEDRSGNKDSHSTAFDFRVPVAEPKEYYDNKGIRKGIVLARYATLLRNWMVHERERSEPPIVMYRDHGIPILPEHEFQLGRWERQSQRLTVSQDYRELFRQFTTYFEEEMNAIGDSSMRKELDILKRLD